MDISLSQGAYRRESLKFMWVKRILSGGTTRQIAMLRLIVCLVLLVFSLIGMIGAFRLPAQIKQQTVLVKYQQQGTFDYLAYLKPSYIYGPVPQTPPAPSKYPSALVDSIDFTFSYTPAAAGAENVWVDEVLENPGVWQKSLRLATTSGSGAITLPFTLDLDQVQSLFSNIEQTISIAATQRNLSIDVYVQTESGVYRQSLPIAIVSGLIEIDNSNLQQKGDTGTGTLEYTVKPKTTISVSATSNPQYPASIADRIDLTYSYSGLGKGASSSFRIEAVLENPGIWQKTVSLINNTSETGDASVGFTLDLYSLNQQFAAIERELNITPGSRSLIINAYVNSAAGDYIQSLPITLSNTLIEVGRDLTSEQPPWKGQFDYSVHLTDSSLFGVGYLKPPAPLQSALPISLDPAELHSPPVQETPAVATKGPGEDIFANLLDKMLVSFTYQFQASQPVNNQSMDATIVATVAAPQAWSKTFTLLQTSKQGNFNLNFPLDVSGYQELIKNINSETGASTGTYNITITANVHTTGDTQYGKINDVYYPGFKGTLNGGILQWDKTLTRTQPGAVSTTRVVASTQKYLGLPRQSCSSRHDSPGFSVPVSNPGFSSLILPI